MSHVLNGHCAGLPLEITFDGGTRSADGRLVSGAGAVLWGPACLDGTRMVLARASVALPGTQLAVVAEAWGCRVGLDLLLQCQPSLRACRVVGDNLAVVRYGAGHGRTRRTEVQAVLEGALGRATALGWRLSWLAVNRRLNEAADAAASRGLARAATLAGGGLFEPQVEVLTSLADGGGDFAPGGTGAVDAAGGSGWQMLRDGVPGIQASAAGRVP